MECSETPVYWHIIANALLTLPIYNSARGVTRRMAIRPSDIYMNYVALFRRFLRAYHRTIKTIPRSSLQRIESSSAMNVGRPSNTSIISKSMKEFIAAKSRTSARTQPAIRGFHIPAHSGTVMQSRYDLT